MARKPVQALLNQFWLLSRRHKLAGFTLLELLVTILIGGIAVSLLLTLVVDLIQTDHKESVRSETQREMQTALDFISQDLREAVYVYSGDCLQGREDDSTTLAINEYCPGIVNHITIPANSVPVLSFWKLEPLPSKCQDTLNEADDPCQPFRVSGRTYSLIVYFLRKKDSVWQGQARITRYVLEQFDNDSDDNLVHRAGYVNPIDSRTSFRTWPRSRQANGTWLSLQVNSEGVPVLPASNPNDTLVDFVDATGGGASDPCATAGSNYITSPSTTTLGTNFLGVRSFYACVREQNGLNQDIIVFLRGNASGKPGIQNANNFLPTLQTQILGRGIVDKQPQPPQ